MVKVYDAATGNLSYARRYKTSKLQLPGFAKKHSYNVRVGNPDMGLMKTLEGLSTDSEKDTITLDFQR